MHTGITIYSSKQSLQTKTIATYIDIDTDYETNPLVT